MKCTEVCKKQAKALEELQELIAELNVLSYAAIEDVLLQEDTLDWVIEQAELSAEIAAGHAGLTGDEFEVAVKEAVTKEVADYYADETIMKAEHREVLTECARMCYKSDVGNLRYTIQRLVSKIRTRCYKCQTENEMLVKLFAEADYAIAKAKFDVAEREFRAVDAEKLATYIK